MKVAVVGSRSYRDLDEVRDFVRNLPSDAVVVSGGALGVDTAAIETASEVGLAHIVFHPNRKKHGKRAGPLRNALIVETADEIHAFWDGVSRGTKSTINQAKKAGKPLTVHRSRHGDKAGT